MKRIFTCTLFLTFVLAGFAGAQERSGGSAVEIQTNWTAMKRLVDQANANSVALDTRVATCGQAHTLYTGRGATGCGSVDVNELQDQMKDVLRCGKLGKVWNADTSACDSGKRVEYGVVRDNSGFSYANRDFNVTFGRPFDSAPKVHLALNKYRFDNNCSQDDWEVDLQASHITRNGFRITMNGKDAGCSRWILNGVLWIAEE